jgi:hypothetical protein
VPRCWRDAHVRRADRHPPGGPVGGDYFAQGTDGVQSQRVYFSFTVLTTTGSGDLTARTGPARALAVLIGQRSSIS